MGQEHHQVTVGGPAQGGAQRTQFTGTDAQLLRRIALLAEGGLENTCHFAGFSPPCMAVQPLDVDPIEFEGGTGLCQLADIPLAAEVIENQGQALSPRGELYTRDNIRQRLTMRDLMESLRSSGVESGGQAPLNHGDRKAFADQLDKIITRHG